MIPPSGGDTFTAVSGFTYTASTGVNTEIGPGDVRMALIRRWTEQPYPVAGSSGSAVSVSGTLGSSVNDYAPAGYVGGISNRLLLTPASGGSVMTGLGAAPDHFLMTLVNQSATDSVSFTHLDPASQAANQFSCPGGLVATLAPLAVSLLRYVVNQWKFAS
jgi:hypothetical protein